MPKLLDTQRLRRLNVLHAKPHINQRELAKAMGVNLGKVNYCLRALIEKGQVKLQNFHRNPDKRHYACLLIKAGWKGKLLRNTTYLYD